MAASLQDLAEAEAQAEVAALAASQRNSSLGKKAAEEATSPDDAATFTEEALQSVRAILTCLLPHLQS